MEFIVRPFDQERFGEGETLAGQLLGDAYALVINGRSYTIPTARTGADRFGAYAVVEEGEWPIGLGLVIKVELLIEEDDALAGRDPGCSVSLFEPGAREKHEAALRAAGVDPSAVNLLVPPRMIYSVDFGASGHADGWGGGGLHPQPPPSSHN